VRVAFGAEVDGPVCHAIRARVSALGHDIVADTIGLGWAGTGLTVGRAVASGAAERGIALCGNGVGVTVGANKVGDVRAALCLEPTTAEEARAFLDANVLTMGFDVLAPDDAAAITETFLATQWNGAEAAEIDAVAARWAGGQSG
jgi:ribose 5-phosphate isomerase B